MDAPNRFLRNHVKTFAVFFINQSNVSEDNPVMTQLLNADTIYNKVKDEMCEYCFQYERVDLRPGKNECGEYLMINLAEF